MATISPFFCFSSSLTFPSSSIYKMPRLPPPSLPTAIPLRSSKRLEWGFKLFAGSDELRRGEGNNDDSNTGSGMKGPAGGGDEGGFRRDRQPAFNLRWGDLLYPDPDNLAAVGLAGLLAWASAQVLFQLFVISLAILLAALKYSFIAALLLFILITLL